MMDLTINAYPISYIVWNIILGIIPFVVCYWMFLVIKSSSKFTGLHLWLLFLLWLAFIPNAVYIISDVRHLNGFCPDTIVDICVKNAWMLPLFFVYSLFGWILYFYAMEQMRIFIKNNISERFSAYFPLLASPIIGLGLLLGLIDRYNSWDLVFRLKLVLLSALSYFTEFESVINLLTYTFLLLVLYYLARLIFKPINTCLVLKKIVKQ